MLNRHSNELFSRLERIDTVGVTEIRKSEIRLWYQQDRISKGIWRDILDKWTEIDSDKQNKVMVGEADDTYVFVWGQGLSEVKKGKAWLKNLSDLANPGSGLAEE